MTPIATRLELPSGRVVPRTERRLAQPAATSRTVLVVDDDPTIGRLLTFYLREAGYSPIYAPDGLQGLVIAAQYQPCLVLLDVMLPGLSGWEVCRELRRSSDVPIIMLTAKGADQDVVTGLNAGADDYVSKPFSGPQLMARVENVMRRSSSGSASSPAVASQPAAAQPETPAVSQAPTAPTEEGSDLPGAQLRRARRDKGISLYHVERRTGIRWDYLQALEYEHLDYIPPHMQRQLFERYAQFLGLDAPALWRKIAGQKGSKPVQRAQHASMMVVLLAILAILTLLMMSLLYLGIVHPLT